MTQTSLNITQITYPKAILAACGLLVVYICSLSFYRLFLHPLRRVPGPRLAALTGWVETYYDCFTNPGGMFMWEYQRMHEKYGPIVRINPNEVHIQDATFYDVLFSKSRQLDKLKRLQNRFGHETSSFATSEHNVHRFRRAALNPFFSKRKIVQHSPNVQEHMHRLCQQIAKDYLGRPDKVLSLSQMWAAYTADVIVGYTLEKHYDFIMNPDFNAGFCDAIASLVGPVHFVTQFPWLINVFNSFPEWVLFKMYPPMRTTRTFFKEMEAQIMRAKAVHAAKDGNSKGVPQSLFTALLDSDLPESELSTLHLQHEAISVIAGGVETSNNTLTIASYHLLANPPMLAKLQAELKAHIPDPQQIPHVDALMQLPYLTGVINEGLRFTYGVAQRLQRECPTSITYRDRTTGAEYVIPPRTEISMDQYSTSHDPEVFPDSHEFRPERWEGNPVAFDGKPLTNYLISFGRGTRSCLGMQLAYAELYIGLATFYRRFECDLYETKRDAVDCYYDLLLARPKPGTKGVRVKNVRSIS